MFFSPTEISALKSKILEFIASVSYVQSTINTDNVLSNQLLSDLSSLKKKLDNNCNKFEWYIDYLKVYEKYFFREDLKVFLDKITEDYRDIWITKAIYEKIELAGRSEYFYVFPNMSNLSAENFEFKFKMKYYNAISNALEKQETAFNFVREYVPEKGIQVNYFLFGDEDDIKVKFAIFVYKSRIEFNVIVNDKDFPYMVFLKTLFELMFA